MTNQHDKLYAERDPMELEPYYFQHMMAMTSEDLHSKSAIAEELAYRDKRIAELEAALRVAREAIESLPADALGTATPIDAYPYPIRDEVINTISQALKGEGDA